ncbi:thiol reductant ABC exporter subunit CydC [Nocardia takedensis]|uniref:thiol reductant ABC exporter subunit CydC n=1 Tax=Nocardia takedensis TaxID=259390 RepID=UPI0002D6FA4F|nr:thiol reductant ABC exporter subunit CydC [Nocardia takedensis]
MWRLLDLSPWRVLVAVAWGTAALGSALALAALSAWLIARAWQMPPVLDLSVAVVAVRALGISRGLARYLERLATHDVALRSMTTARATVYGTLARSPAWLRRRVSSPAGAIEAGPWTAEPGAAVGSGVFDRRPPIDGSGVPAPDRASRRGEPEMPSFERSAPDASALRRGDLLVRIGTDIDDLGAFVVRVLVPVAVAVLLSGAAVGLLATISVPAAAILALALLVTGVAAPWLSARAARDAELAVRADRAEFTARAVTVLDHAAELRVAGRLDDAVREAREAGERAAVAEDSAAARSAWAVAATPLSIGVSVLAALLIGITLYGPDGGALGTMTPMALTILVLLPLSAFEAVGPLPAAARAYTTARAAYRRLSDLADEEPRVTNASARATDETARSAELSRSDRFESALPEVVRLFPDLPEGRRIAVVGPSGAGKTTLLMRWAGLFGVRRTDTTFFAEDAHLFGTSVFENLRVARGDLTEAEAEKALRAVGLGDWLDTLPAGLGTELVGGAAAVSGGQRRRILLARALLAPARVLLLDEPTEHLEAEAGATLVRDLLDPASGLVDPDRVVVVVTHQLPADHRADLVLSLDAHGGVDVADQRIPPSGKSVAHPPRLSVPSSVHKEGGGSKNGYPTDT